MGVASAGTREWRAAIADAAGQLLREWEIESLPAHLTRSNSDFYYLSVWPGLAAADPVAGMRLPDRPVRTEYAYIHIPFCSGLCNFCSYFLSVSRDADGDPRVSRYLDDLIAQAGIDQGNSELDLSYVYLGGGTPSLLHPDQMERLLAGFSRLGILSPRIIGTIEFHPEIFADQARMTAMLDTVAAYGIKRVSLGFQSSDPDILRATNRRHDPNFLLAAVRQLQDRDFGVNIDLMYGLPGQSLESWLHSLELALLSRPDSISTYFTFIDYGTLLWRRTQRDPAMLLTHTEIQLQHLAAQISLEWAGYHELPGDFYSKPAGDPSRYVQEALPSASNTLALGAGAYGYYPGVQYFHFFDFQRYSDMVRGGQSPVWRAAVLTSEEELCRDIMFSLKNAPSLDMRIFADRHGISPLDSHPDMLAELASLDLAVVSDDKVQLTAKGRLLVEEIACAFAPPRRRGSGPGSRRDATLLRKHNFVPAYPAPGE
jgi:oxygen-independent coproporphyrinogen III oxidase